MLAIPAARQPAVAHCPPDPLPDTQPDPGPLAMLPYVDTASAPEQGSLAWLLAYGLPSDSLTQYLPPEIMTSEGSVAQDPGLMQAWDHARSFYQDSGGPGVSGPAFAPPAAESLAAEPTSLYEQTRKTFTDLFCVSFRDAFRIHRSRNEGLQRCVTSYLLSHDIPAGVGRNFAYAERYSALEIFGLTADGLRSLLADLKLKTFERMKTFALERLPELDEPESREIHRAALDFGEYVDDCIERVYDLRREYDDPGRPMSWDAWRGIGNTALALNGVVA